MREKKEIEIRNLISEDFATKELVRDLIYKATKDLGRVRLNYDWEHHIFLGNDIELPVDELLRMLLKHLNLEVEFTPQKTELKKKKKLPVKYAQRALKGKK